jgi:alkylhydroperoxidase family enzyme
LALLDNDAAWARLPKVAQGEPGRPLPVWARALAGPLPRTTAAMLELDYAYRTSEAFDPRSRGLMRWVAAKANRCDYGRRYAEADLLRAGMSDEEIERLESILAELPARETVAIAFAEKLTLSANLVTDEEVAELIEAFGEPAVVAMVLQLAYANFQDRLILAIGAEVEEGGPLAPIEVRFAPPAQGESIAAARPELVEPQATDAAPIAQPGREWGAVSLAELIRGMNEQSEREGRVSVPAWEEVHPKLPPGMYPPDRKLRIRWSLVVLGHQPELGSAWMNCLRTFGREANQDRVLEESIFWVITRSIDCFY